MNKPFSLQTANVTPCEVCYRLLCRYTCDRRRHKRKSVCPRQPVSHLQRGKTSKFFFSPFATHWCISSSKHPVNFFHTTAPGFCYWSKQPGRVLYTASQRTVQAQFPVDEQWDGQSAAAGFIFRVLRVITGYSDPYTHTHTHRSAIQHVIRLIRQRCSADCWVNSRVSLKPKQEFSCWLP